MRSNQNCWNFARLELRCQILTCSIFMKFWLVMTKSVTLAALHLAGENSKMHPYKQKVQKMKDLPNTAFDQENSLKISEEKKNRNIIHDL